MLTLTLTSLITNNDAATIIASCCRRSGSCDPIGQFLVGESCCHEVDEPETLSADDVPHLGLS